MAFAIKPKPELIYAVWWSSPLDTIQRSPVACPIMSKTKTRIMYIENKSASLNGPARIGRVTFSKTGKSLNYGGRTFQSLKGHGCKANYFDVETGEEFWISGPRKDGNDRLYPESSLAVEIDPDVAEEYWRDVRGRTSHAK